MLLTAGWTLSSAFSMVALLLAAGFLGVVGAQLEARAAVVLACGMVCLFWMT